MSSTLVIIVDRVEMLKLLLLMLVTLLKPLINKVVAVFVLFGDYTITNDSGIDKNNKTNKYDV